MPAATVQRMRPLEGRLFSLSDNQNGMIARPEDRDLDDVGLLRGEVVPDEPVVFRRHLGNVPRDLVMGASVSLLLISEHVRSILAGGSFTGWATYPVRLLDRRGDEVAGYHGLAVTGRSKQVDRAERQEMLDSGDFGERVWACRGAEDFYLDGSSSLVVVKRSVAVALRAGKVTNLHLVPVAT